MKKIYFLSGMQRSGSTLLACLLNQHPEIYATPTSPMLDIISSCRKTLDEVYEQYTFNYEEKNKSLVNGILSSFHENIDEPIIVDKHRGWIVATKLIKDFYSPKIVCTNRSVPEVISSFIKLIENNKSTNNTVDKALRNSGLPISINNRADYIFNYFIDSPRKAIIDGLSEYRNLIHIVEYNDIVNNPQDTMNNIYQFLEIEKYNHNFNNINNTCKEEKDLSWGIENLHAIRNKLQKISTPPEEVLGRELTEYYSQFDVKYS
jgi:sulfotransferase